MKTTDVPNPMDKEYIRQIGKAVHDKLPDGYAFIVFAFPTMTKDARCLYISNAQRDDAVAALKEWLLKVSPEEWLKHLK